MQAALRAPGGPAGAGRAVARAPPGRPGGAGGGRRPRPRALVGARRPRGTQERPACVLTSHGTDAALLRRSRHRPAPRPAGLPPRAASSRPSPASWRAGSRTPPGVTSSRRTCIRCRWTATAGRGPPGGGRRGRRPAHPAEARNLAIEALAVLASCGHDLPLTIVGDGPERAALERQVERLGIASVRALRRRGTAGRSGRLLAHGGRHALSRRRARASGWPPPRR